jgi:hypothetical protein
MRKSLTIVIVCVVIAGAALASAFVGLRRAGAPPQFDTTYQAVLLDTGQVYYGKLSRLGTSFPEMSDVYYIVRTQDAQTKQVKNILVKRGKELHAPAETFFAARHIIMIEPVGPSSEVARDIAQEESQNK